MDLDELGQRLREHRATGFKRLCSLCKEEIRRGNGCAPRDDAKGPGWHLHTLKIGDMQKIGLVGERWVVVGLCDPPLLLFGSQGVLASFYCVVLP